MVSGVAPARVSAFITRTLASSRCSSASRISASAGWWSWRGWWEERADARMSPYTERDNSSHGTYSISRRWQVLAFLGCMRSLNIQQKHKHLHRFAAHNCLQNGSGVRAVCGSAYIGFVPTSTSSDSCFQVCCQPSSSVVWVNFLKQISTANIHGLLNEIVYAAASACWHQVHRKSSLYLPLGSVNLVLKRMGTPWWNFNQVGLKSRDTNR